MKTQIINKTFDAERALYHLQDSSVVACTFAGPADGESVLKESQNIDVCDCRFSLRYPMWHTRSFCLRNSYMDELTRAPLWYADNGKITDCNINGIKCLRECQDIEIKNTIVHSPEFSWKCRRLKITDSDMESQYFLFESQDVQIDRLKMKGKYSFQYTENMEITDSELDTKDAFWHSKNVTVRNSIVKGEYLGWYSEGLTLIDCKIIGTQPLCYCKGLKLIDCTMEKTDLSFECSDVQAEVKGNIVSVKNPRSGTIMADSIGEIILEEAVMETDCIIGLRTQNGQ